MKVKSLSFFDNPIINSPYEEPNKHWHLEDGRPTDEIISRRRKSDLISAMPKSKSEKSRRLILNVNHQLFD